MQFKKWINLVEKTLYHGTTTDNEKGIKQIGLIGQRGDFVSHFYDDENSKNDDEETVTFATDKENLQKAVSAMEFHIAQKLNKYQGSVTNNDIRNHGLLVIIRDGDYYMDKFNPSDKKWIDQQPPIGLEPDDYYASNVRGDLFLKGSALVRFLKKHNLWHEDNFYRGKLGAMGIRYGLDKDNVLSKIKNRPSDDVRGEYRKWLNYK